MGSAHTAHGEHGVETIDADFFAVVTVPRNDAGITRHHQSATQERVVERFLSHRIARHHAAPFGFVDEDDREHALEHLEAGGAVFAVQMPVSYTHLRAHETPEHLVCR